MEKTERNKIYKQALNINVDYDGYDRAFRYMQSKIENFSIKKYRHKALPELALFDEKVDYGEYNKYDTMKIRDIALMFCIEMTK